ncbi:MAG: hypothetical protein NTX53_21925 [candidate division WOR-3 bacterium]|nr:hypothetical protein [candidate division WOR-3 bacterium]
MACWLVFSFHGRPKRGIDDAQILFSYSSNLAAGHGLVYANNPEHVEGATSFLWTLICAIPFRLGLDESGVLAIAVLILCLTQILILDIIRRSAAARQLPSWPFELAYLFLVFSCPAYFTWMSITLMDTCLWGFLLVLMIYVALQPPRSPLGMVVASIPFFFAPLSRPEAVLVAPSIIVLAWVHDEASQEDRRRLVLSLTTAVFVSVAAVTIFRLSYFGYPLPNTYYAKVSPSLVYNLQEGRDYLYRYASTSGPIIAISVLFVLGLAAWCAGALAVRLSSYLRTRRWPFARIANWKLSALAAAILLFIPVLTGGDHFSMFRFYQPAYPLMILALVLSLMAWSPAGASAPLASLLRLKRHLVPSCFLSLLLAYGAYHFLQAPSWSSIRDTRPIRGEFFIAENGIRTGKRLSGLFAGAATLPTIGVYAAGGVARTYPGRIVDLMGLNTPAIAHYPGDHKGIKNHAAFEKDAFFKLGRIDLLLASPPVPPETANFGSRAFKGLMYDPRFVREWRYGLLYLSGDQDDGLEAFYYARYVDSLVATARYQFRETMKWSNKWVAVDSAGGAEIHN